MPNHSEITAFIETFKSTAFAKDVSGFLALYDDDARIFDLWKKWSYRGVAAWKPAVEEWFKHTGENRDAISLHDVVIQGAEGFCTVTAFITFSCVDPKGVVLRAMHERLTLVLTKSQSGWKILHQHSSAPVGDDLKIRFDRD
ncbi:MAG TPA: nuclear transport factor 2 family protein [Opitutaceae bacterium]